MSIPTISDLLKDKTKEDFFNEIVQAAIDEKLSTTAWAPGEPIRAAMAVFARVLAALWTLIAVPAIRAAFLDYATGAWLTLLAWTSYNVKRKGAEFATKTITVENRGPTAYFGLSQIAAGQLRIKNEETGKTFTNVANIGIAAWLGVGPYPTADGVFVADEAGTASDTLQGLIATLPVSAPSGIVVQTNTSAILGSEEETDEALRARCRLATAPMSPAGPADAYRFVALSTLRPDGSYVSVTRVRIVDAGACSLNVYLAARSGPALGAMNAPGTDIFLVYQKLLKDVVPNGIKCSVYPAIEAALTIDVTLIVDPDSGLTLEEAKTKAEVAIAEYLAAVPIGGRRTTPALLPTDSGKLLVSDMLAKASESAVGIVQATSSLGAFDMTIPYNAIPNVSYTITAIMVKQ